MLGFRVRVTLLSPCWLGSMPSVWLGRCPLAPLGLVCRAAALSDGGGERLCGDGKPDTKQTRWLALSERRLSFQAGDSGPGRGVFAALGRFGEDAGLDRSLEIAADLNNIARSSTLDGPIHLVRRRQGLLRKPGSSMTLFCLAALAAGHALVVGRVYVLASQPGSLPAAPAELLQANAPLTLGEC